MEFFLLGASAWAGYLGWQWRRTRELGEEIRSLRASTTAGPEATLPNPALEAKEQVPTVQCLSWQHLQAVTG